MINITFPDGAVRQYEQGSSSMDIAKSISEGLARKILAAEINGEIWDLSRPLNNDATIKF
ncbi:MAG: TGS domain-containing protein, partial [Ginsengibacter sp.]